MVGYIVEHAAVGLAKITHVDPEPNGLVHVKSLSDAKPYLFDKEELSSSLRRAYLALGTECESPKGRCSIASIARNTAADRPVLYNVVYAENALADTLPETDLAPVSNNVYQDPLSLLAGLKATGYPFFRAREDLLEVVHQMWREGAGLRSLLSSRIDLRSHQAYVAGVVMLDRRRRYLLADEVGLGKTIEAGIVIADTLQQKPGARILIICPGGLTQQWLCEMYSKFSQKGFCLLDLHGPDIEWESLTKAIVSLSLSQKLADKLQSVEWDMVVVDEAHHLLGSSSLYKLVKSISAKAPCVLLLSAIPARHREDEFRRLLVLLEPDKYSHLSTEQFSQLYDVQRVIGRKLRLLELRVEAVQSQDASADEALQKVHELLEIDALKHDLDLQKRVEALNPQASDFLERIQQIRHYIGDNYRINRRILRNRRQRLVEDGQMAGIPRLLQPCPYRPDQLEVDATEAVHALLLQAKSNRAPATVLLPSVVLFFESLSHPGTAAALVQCLLSAGQGRLAPQELQVLSLGHLAGYDDCRQYRQVLCKGLRPYVDDDQLQRALAATRAWRGSSSSFQRYTRLVDVIRARLQTKKPVKLLLFAGFPGLAHDLTSRLRKDFGDECVAEFNYGAPRDEKELNVLRFRRNRKTILLVSDETGGEGRNFQFATELIHFDSPWSPSKIEQRIGRLDRLGRELEADPAVISNVIYNEWSPESGLIDCYRSGLKVYSESLSGLEFALRDVEHDLATVALADGAEGLSKYATPLAERAVSERAADATETVFDEGSFERVTAQRYQRVSRSDDTETQLTQAFSRYFELISAPGAVRAITESDSKDQVWVFGPDSVRAVQLPMTPSKDGTYGDRRGTFCRAVAQRRPDLAFFNVADDLFEAVWNSLGTSSCGRTYAIECTALQRSPWIGFEFVFTCGPCLDVVQDSPGLSNLAKQVFQYRPVHLFFRINGQVSDEGDDLLEIRRSLRLEDKNHTWWNLTKEKATLLPSVYEDADWHGNMRKIAEQAKLRARSMFAGRLEVSISEEVTRIDDMKRAVLRDRTPNASTEIEGLEKLLKAVQGWDVCLDSAGFLSINGEILRSAL